MKVIDVTEFYSERGGGVRSYLDGKQHILCQLGHESILLVPGPEATSTDGVRKVGGPAMPYDATYHLLWRPDKIRAAVGAEQPDVLEIHSPYVAAVSALACSRRSFGIRTFMWHSDFIDTYKRVLGALRPAARPALDAAAVPLWAWVRAIARGCAATFCASGWQARKLGEHGVRATIVPFGVDKELFHPREAEPHVGVRLVACGRLAIEKRWDVVLEAFGMIRREHRDATLTVFGDGPERAKLEALAPPGVTFEGFVKGRAPLAEAIAGADALLHGCPHETFGIAVAEAVASATPVVVPDEGAASELAHAGCSETYASGDAEACAAATLRLLARRGPAVRDAARRASLTIGSTREHFERLLTHYRELLHR